MEIQRLFSQLGLDRGFGDTKYCSNLAKGSFNSLIAPVSQKRALDILSNNANNDKLLMLKYNNQYYLAGDYVSLLEPNFAERDLSRERNNENESLLFMIGLGLATGSIEYSSLVLTTGLPTSDYEKMNEQYEKQIENGHNPYKFSIFKGNKEYPKDIIIKRANVENQPKGTIINVLNKSLRSAVLDNLSWQKLCRKRYGVADIGFNTTDLSIYTGKDLVLGVNNNFSTFALAKILTDIQTAIENNHTCKKSQNDIIEALSTFKVKVKGVEVDCSKEIEEGFRLNINKLAKEIKSKWENYLDSLDEIILTGGILQNELFCSIAKESFKKELGWEVTIPENPQMSNAEGFLLISKSIKVD